MISAKKAFGGKLNLLYSLSLILKGMLTIEIIVAILFILFFYTDLKIYQQQL